METAAQWTQGNGVVGPAAEENSIRPTQKKPRPEKEKAVNCPRCNSTNTKFCYYNNYSLSQPRYFCKSCRRYWTHGGTLRNVPVGGGSRKARRSISSRSSSKKAIPDPSPPKFSTENPNYRGQDLNLAYDPPKVFNGVSAINVDSPFVLDMGNANYPCSKNTSSGGPTSLLTTSMPLSNPNFFSFPLLDFKSSLDFPLDNITVGMQPASVQKHHTSSTSGAFFPLEELKATSSSDLGEININGDWNQCWLGIPGENM